MASFLDSLRNLTDNFSSVVSNSLFNTAITPDSKNTDSMKDYYASKAKPKEEVTSGTYYPEETWFYDPGYYASGGQRLMNDEQWERWKDNDLALGGVGESQSASIRNDERHSTDNGSFRVDEDPTTRYIREEREKASEGPINVIGENSWLRQNANLFQGENLGAAARHGYYAPVMTYNKDEYYLDTNDDGVFIPRSGSSADPKDYTDLTHEGLYGAEVPAAGTLVDRGNFMYRGGDGNFYLLPEDPTKGVDTIGWAGSTSIEDPTYWIRDAYDVMNDPEFIATMRDRFDMPNFKADLMALQTGDPEAWQYFHEKMRERGWYKNDETNPDFLDEDGNFSYDKYFDFINNNVDPYEFALGDSSDIASDWITSGDISVNRLVADYLASTAGIPWAVGEGDFQSSKQFQDLVEAARNGTLTKDETYGYLTTPESNYGFLNDEDGNTYVFTKNLDNDEFANYILAKILQSGLTNNALDYQYGSYSPTATSANVAASILRNTDQYYDSDEAIADILAYYNAYPEEYRDYMNPQYASLLSYMKNKPEDFNLAPTVAGRNPKVKKK